LARPARGLNSRRPDEQLPRIRGASLDSANS
jgi:hypothetical protein